MAKLQYNYSSLLERRCTNTHTHTPSHNENRPPLLQFNTKNKTKVQRADTQARDRLQWTSDTLHSAGTDMKKKSSYETWQTGLCRQAAVLLIDTYT